MRVMVAFALMQAARVASCRARLKISMIMLMVLVSSFGMIFLLFYLWDGSGHTPPIYNRGLCPVPFSFGTF